MVDCRHHASANECLPGIYICKMTQIIFDIADVTPSPCFVRWNRHQTIENAKSDKPGKITGMDALTERL